MEAQFPVAISPELLQEIALTPQEYAQIVQRLDREPNALELGLFGALWSEHCGYKHSKHLLRNLPSESPRLLAAPGAENAGVVDIGNGLALVVKIESHNHPSAVEPFHGAATGVGGIVRDILAMGARPIALLNSLRFGPPEETRSRYLFHGVVGGISWYGNCIGVPDVGGEIVFSPSYARNPLVNAMCVGILPKERLLSATATGPGNLLLLVGADTGRDGIHGASGLASRAFEEERELRPTVQVGNPFLEKVLIEACLEVAEKLPEAIIGMQDLGAAGLTSAAIECAAKGGTGLWIDVTKVPPREEAMTPYDIMLSESQERMLLVLKPEFLDSVRALFDKWDLTSSVIGRVTDDGLARIYDGDSLVAQVPVSVLTEPPQYRLQGVKPSWIEEAHATDLGAIPLPALSPDESLLRLLASINIASRRPVYRQYDHQVGANTVVSPGVADAAVLRVPGTNTGIALTVDGNGRYCYLDPYAGGAIAVAEACRNLACVGAQGIALTDCLNFGNPERREVYYQLEECINGMAAACRALGVPIVSGNVSLYNETDGEAIYPTPIVGAVGLLEEVSRHCTAGFRNPGDVIILLGAAEVAGNSESLGGSEILALLHGRVSGRPSIDLALEERVQRLCRDAIAQGLVNSAHDCADAGLAVTLAESCLAGDLGAEIAAKHTGRWDAALFGETQSRIVVSVAPEQLPALERLAAEASVPHLVLGLVGGVRLAAFGLLDVSLGEMREAWDNGLERAVH